MKKELDNLAMLSEQTRGCSFNISYRKDGYWVIHFPNARVEAFINKRLITAVKKAAKWIEDNRSLMGGYTKYYKLNPNT